MIAKEENITKAANSSFVSQSVLSRSLMRLEVELGVQLFTRKGKRLRLNEYGTFFYQKVQSALSMIDEASETLKEYSHEMDSVIRIKMTSSLRLLPELMASFKRDNPEYHNLDFQLVESPGAEPVDVPYDICISTPLIGDVQSGALVLADEEVLMAIPKSSRFYGYSEISLYDLKAEPFVAIKRHNVFRKVIDDYLFRANFTPNIVFETDSTTSLIHAIDAGFGLAFWGSFSKSDILSSNISLAHITNPPFIRSICLTYPNKKRNSKNVKAFVDYAITFFKNKS